MTTTDSLTVDGSFDQEKLALAYPDMLMFSGTPSEHEGQTTISIHPQFEAVDEEELRTYVQACSLGPVTFPDPRPVAPPAPVKRQWPAWLPGVVGGTAAAATVELLRLLWH